MREKFNYEHFKELKTYSKNSIDFKILKELELRDLIKVDKDTFKFHTVGFILILNEILVVFPKVYNDEFLNESDIRTLFHTLKRYKRTSNLKEEEYEQLGGNDQLENSSLLVAFNIIEDFLENGIISRRRKYSDNSLDGRINWQKTILYKDPIFSDGSPIYHEPITTRSINDKNSILIKLHEYAVNWSVNTFGWLYSIEKNSININQKNIPCSLEEAIIILRRELLAAYSDRDIRSIKMLIGFYQGLTGEAVINNISTFSTPYFHNVWENICVKLYKDEKYKLEEIIPAPKWSIDSSAQVKKQNPDILFKEEEKLYIIDAKYYNVRSNFPGWGDLVKQFFYSHTIIGRLNSFSRKKNEQKTHIDYSEKTSNTLESYKRYFTDLHHIYNIFIFPKTDYDEPDLVSYLGSTEVEDNKELGSIFSFSIEMKKAMIAYTDETFVTDKYRLSLKRAIEEHKVQPVSRLK